GVQECVPTSRGSDSGKDGRAGVPGLSPAPAKRLKWAAFNLPGVPRPPVLWGGAGRTRPAGGETMVGRRRGQAVSGVLGSLVLLASLDAAAEESKSWVVSWFTPAVYSTDGDCPGRNPSIDGIYRGAIRQLGVSKAEEERLFAKYE